jgi:hypothetical protein
VPEPSTTGFNAGTIPTRRLTKTAPYWLTISPQKESELKARVTNSSRIKMEPNRYRLVSVSFNLSRALVVDSGASAFSNDFLQRASKTLGTPDFSLPVALQPASRRRSFLQLRTSSACPMRTSTSLLVRTFRRTKRSVPLCCFKPGTVRLPRCQVRLFQQGLDKKIGIASILLVLNHQRSDLVYAF